MRKLVKILLLVFILAVVFSASSKALDVNSFPYVSSIKLENILIVYINQDASVDPLEIRVCFLGKAYKYQGFSISELFTEVCPSDKVELIAVFLNTIQCQWIFFYKEIK